MIVTVTPNPSVDHTLDVAEFERGRLHRAVGSHVHAGGKGVNVARALAAHGVRTRAVVPAGGAEGAQLLELLAARGIDVVPVTVSSATRVNLAIVEPDGTVTKVNAPGGRLSQAELEALLAAVRTAADGASWVVTCGSLPPGAAIDLHAGVIRIARAVGVRVAVDTSGPALLAALAAGPDLAKPNRRELEEAVGTPIASRTDAAAAAHALQARGARAVLASLGADGALLAADGAVLHVEAPEVPVRSTVGAGDTLLAGYLAGGEGATGLGTGVEWATRAIAQPGTSVSEDGAMTARLVGQAADTGGESR